MFFKKKRERGKERLFLHFGHPELEGNTLYYIGQAAVKEEWSPGNWGKKGMSWPIFITTNGKMELI